MNTLSSTANINKQLDQISSATAAAKRAGLLINTAFEGDFFCCIAMEQNINRTIDLTNENASVKLNSLLEHIHGVTPSSVALQGGH